MIDHILGRPSQSIKKVQVLVVACFWVAYIVRGPRHGPPIIWAISKFLSKHATAWQIHVLTMTGLYVLKNIDKLLNLQSPEPLADLYSRPFFRASWFLTALDAGFWTAMPVKPKAFRDIASILFSVYYLIFADQADEKVRKVRATITAEHLRISWEKSTSPYLRLAKIFTCPRIQILKAFEIPRPPNSPYRSRMKAYLYYDGPRHTFKHHTKVLLDFPGGGFVSQSPRHHDDALCAWAKKLKVPVISLNYGKAPEHPYPYSLDECYDAYIEIVRTKGRCIGLSGTVDPQLVLVGDSAGGNFVAGVMLKLLTTIPQPRLPISLLMIYPALDLNFNSWMSDEQIRLLRQESVKELNSPGLMKRKESIYQGLSGKLHVEDEDMRDIDEFSLPSSLDAADPLTRAGTASSLREQGRRTQAELAREKKIKIGTSLAMTSRVSYFGDKIITPEMLRAMIILYIGPHSRPDFTTDYLLSPVNAPSELLAKFPKVYMICGEVDPLVDDTVIFAGRLREAKRSAMLRYEALAMSKPPSIQSESEFVDVMLIRGISHGFMQLPFLLPEAKAGIARCAAWIQEAFALHEPRYRTAPVHPSSAAASPHLALQTQSNKLATLSSVSLGSPTKKRGLLARVLRGLLARSGLGWIAPLSSGAIVDDEYDDDDNFYYEYEDDEDDFLDSDQEQSRPHFSDKCATESFPQSRRQADAESANEAPIEISIPARKLLTNATPLSESSSSSGLFTSVSPLSSNDSIDSTAQNAIESKSSLLVGGARDGYALQPYSGNSKSSQTSSRGHKPRRKVIRHRSWDQNHLVLEGELMDRRRNNLVRSLAALEQDGVQNPPSPELAKVSANQPQNSEQ
ncbi:Alpha/Beta hydrolase protein [Lipomyces orientalis]|uniref:Alpha/Beta hydrolase protein n=1 Tax=Lipomyces orientalis TaxID=1233043 RepID=A0ACC3TUC5_9ASCO